MSARRQCQCAPNWQPLIPNVVCTGKVIVYCFTESAREMSTKSRLNRLHGLRCELTSITWPTVQLAYWYENRLLLNICIAFNYNLSQKHLSCCCLYCCCCRRRRRYWCCCCCCYLCMMVSPGGVFANHWKHLLVNKVISKRNLINNCFLFQFSQCDYILMGIFSLSNGFEGWRFQNCSFHYLDKKSTLYFKTQSSRGYQLFRNKMSNNFTHTHFLKIKIGGFFFIIMLYTQPMQIPHSFHSI